MDIKIIQKIFKRKYNSRYRLNTNLNALFYAAISRS